MRKVAAFALPLLLVLAFVATGCGKGSTTTGSTGTGCANGDSVTLNADNFAVSCINIKAGDTLKWVNPASGTTHLLCVGKEMACDTSITDGPSDLSGKNQLEVDPGDTKTSKFSTKGDFPITCTVHQNMDMVVHVQ